MERLTELDEYTEQARLKYYTDKEWEGLKGLMSDVQEMDVMNAINKLAKLEDLEEQGLLLKLPCKVGDTVYEIAGVKWVGDRDWQYQSHKEAYAKETKFTLEKYNMFGLTVFLTKEEAEKKIAEKALEEMEK